MLQTIGLIVATYAIVRLLQIPLEHVAHEEDWLWMPFAFRAGIVCGLSGAGLLLLLWLVIALLSPEASVLE